MFLRITKNKENHTGFQRDDVEGFDFIDSRYFSKYINDEIYAQEISLPTENPQFCMVQHDFNGYKIEGKWHSNMIISGEYHDLSDVETFKMLHNKNASLNGNNNCVLLWAAKNGYSEIVKFLFEIGLKYNARQACLDAVMKGHLETVKIFVDELKINFCSTTALKWSSRLGYFEIVKFVMEKNVAQYDIDDAFQQACEHGHYEIVELLAKDVNIHLNKNYALRKACKNGHLKIAKFLIEKGARIYDKNNYALRNACKNGHFDIVELLIAKKVNINSCERKPLSLAVRGNHFDIVKLLVANDAIIRTNNNDCELCYAFKNNYLEDFDLIVKKLVKGNIRNQLNADTHRHYDLCPLCQATQNGNLEIFKFLSEKSKIVINTKINITRLLYLAELANRQVMIDYLKTIDVVEQNTQLNY